MQHSGKQDTKGIVYVFNSLGAKVKEITGINLKTGNNKISLDGFGFANGVYMVEIHMGDIKMVKKIVKF